MSKRDAELPVFLLCLLTALTAAALVAATAHHGLGPHTVGVVVGFGEVGVAWFIAGGLRTPLYRTWGQAAALSVGALIFVGMLASVAISLGG